MKVICKNAKVTTLYINPRGAITHPMLECRIDCPVCRGAGWTEEAVVAVSEVEYAMKQLGEFIENVALHNPDCKVVMLDDIKDWLDSLKITR